MVSAGNTERRLGSHRSYTALWGVFERREKGSHRVALPSLEPGNFLLLTPDCWICKPEPFSLAPTAFTSIQSVCVCVCLGVCVCLCVFCGDSRGLFCWGRLPLAYPEGTQDNVGSPSLSLCLSGRAHRASLYSTEEKALNAGQQLGALVLQSQSPTVLGSLQAWNHANILHGC